MIPRNLSVPRKESKKYFTLLPWSNFREIRIPSSKRKQKKQPNKFPDLSALFEKFLRPLRVPPSTTTPNIPKSRRTGPLKADTENASIDAPMRGEGGF